VSRPAFRLGGEGLEAHATLIRDGIEKGKMEPVLSGSNLPSFPVQNANGKYRLVQDFRMLNLVTDRDAHPLPTIMHILHCQWKCEICSKLYLDDGFHQMPLKGEHRHFKCTITSKGVFQWTVLVMGCRGTIPTNDGMGS